MKKVWQVFRDHWVMEYTSDGFMTANTTLGNAVAISMAVELGLLCWALCYY